MGAPDRRLEELEMEGWTKIRPSGFTQLIGPILSRVVDERRSYGFLVEQKHDNTQARAHGGMIMSFCDEALGLAACASRPGRMMFTIEFGCQFIAGAKMGAFIEIEPEVVRSSRSLVFMRGTCLCAGEVVATCSGIWKLVETRGASA